MRKYSVIWDSKLKKWMVVYPDNSRIDQSSRQNAIEWAVNTARSHRPSELTIYKKNGEVGETTVYAVSLDDQFSELAEKAIEEAEKIDCSLEEFLDGLKTMAGLVGDRIAGVEEELAGRDKDESEEETE